MLGAWDTWTAFQFDAAVSYFGVWAENRLNEFDPKTGKHLYTLDDVLADAPLNPVSGALEKLRAVTGGGIRGGNLNWGKKNK